MSHRGPTPKRSHTTAAWRALRLEVLATSNLCGICGEPIDHDAPPRSTRAPSVDMIVPEANGGSTTDRANLRPAHFGCNSRRRNDTQRPALPTTRAW